MANEQQLLVGDYVTWLQRAGELAGSDPLAARALYGMLARDAAVPSEIAAQASLALAGLLPGGEQSVLLWRLYGPELLSGGLLRVAPPLRYRLAEIALARGDWPAAAAIFRDLPTAPDAAFESAWLLKRAEVFLNAGEVDAGTALLETWEPLGADIEQQQRMGRLVARLQGLGRHAAAARILDKWLPAAAPDVPRRAALLVALAASRAALGRYQEAAWLYLQGADAGDGEPWVVNARLQALELLIRIGLHADAGRLAQTLREAALDASARSRLDDLIQQIVLAQN